MKRLNLVLIATLLSAAVASLFVYNTQDNEKAAEVHFKKSTDKVSNEDNKSDCHIFFDVGGVLLKNSSPSAIKAVGVSNMFWYTVKHKKTPTQKDIQGKLFDFIDYCTKQPRGSAKVGGLLLPQIMCDWAKGRTTTQAIINKIQNYEKEANDFFTSEEEKNLVLGTLNLFKPKVIKKIQRPITEMIQLFQECTEAFPGRVYILSNWDKESAALIRKKYPQIFKRIAKNHILFSGDIDKLKPEKSIFTYVENKLKLKSQNCILIDDHNENTEAAIKYGWKAILHTSANKTAHELEKAIK